MSWQSFRALPGAPDDLRAKACELAGALLELGGKANSGQGAFVAARTLADGIAWAKFQRICDAQGGMRTPPVAGLTHEIVADREGIVEEIDNRRIAKVAKTGRGAGGEVRGSSAARPCP